MIAYCVEIPRFVILFDLASESGTVLASEVAVQ